VDGFPTVRNAPTGAGNDIFTTVTNETGYVDVKYALFHIRVMLAARR